MTQPITEPITQRLSRLGEELAREQDALRERAPLPASLREQLIDLQPSVAGVSVRRIGVASFAGVGLAAAAALVLWLRPVQPAALTLSVGAQGRPVSVGAWLEASKTESLPMLFSDGTRVQMQPRARVRVVELSNHGAQLALESGSARVKVTRKPHAAWRVSAGPFSVRITGTRFDVRWNPEQDEFELALREGHVEISGCVFGQGYRMRAGQTVHASCRRGHFEVGDGDAAGESAKAAGNVAPLTAASAASASADATSAGDPTSAEPAPVRSHAAAAHGGEHLSAWRTLAEQGLFREALAAANAAGFDGVCQSASASDLRLLADAARYGGDVAKENKALASSRRRFASTESAALAAFALGRLEFDEHGSYRKAAGWFVTYLKEQPHGALRREARGRLLEATLRAGDVSAAKTLAEHYLRDYPAGPHAKLAQRIVSDADSAR